MANQECLPETLASVRAWAEALHAGQVRGDGTPVFAHAQAVAAQLQELGETAPALLCAALLHDAVESGRATGEEIAARLGPEVARLVEAVTRPPAEDAAASATRAAEAGREALLLRLTDRLDGVRRSRGRSEEKARSFLAVTRAVHLPRAQAHFPALAALLEQALAEAESGAG